MEIAELRDQIARLRPCSEEAIATQQRKNVRTITELIALVKGIWGVVEGTKGFRLIAGNPGCTLVMLIVRR